MADIGGSIGSTVQSHARTRGPFDGKLYIFEPTEELPDYEHFYDLTAGRYTTSDYGFWRLLRMVKEFNIAMNESDRTVRKENWKGKDVPVEGFYQERAPSVKFTLGEQFNPYDLQLGLMAQTPIAAVAGTWGDEFAMTLQGTRKFPLPLEFNIKEDLDNDVTDVTGSPYATGGHVPDGNHWYAVCPVFGTVEAPWAIEAESAQVTTTGGGLSIVTVQWAYTGVAPDAFNVYRGTASATYASSSKVGNVPGVDRAIVDTLANNALGLGKPQLPGVVPGITVKSLDDVTTYSPSTDYTIDYTNGTIARTANSTIGQGEMVHITMSAGLAPGVVMTFDQGRFKSLHLPLMFVGQQSGTVTGESDSSASSSTAWIGQGHERAQPAEVLRGCWPSLRAALRLEPAYRPLRRGRGVRPGHCRLRSHLTLELSIGQRNRAHNSARAGDRVWHIPSRKSTCLCLAAP